MDKADLNLFTQVLKSTMSPNVLRVEMLPLSVSIMKLLAKGHPLSAERISSHCSLSLNDAKNCLSDFQEIGLAELDNQGNLIGMVLTLNQTQHRFRVNGIELFTWCAIDTLFLPTVLQKIAEIESICPITKNRIRLTVSPQGIKKVDPTETVLSIVAPGLTPGVTANCGSSCLTGTQGTFCSNVYFFNSKEAGLTWLANHDGALIIPVEEAYSLAQDVWGKPFIESA